MGAGTITQPRRHGTLFAGLAAIGLAWALAAADAPAVRAQPAGNPVAGVAPWFIDFQRGPAAIEVCRRQGGHRWQAARLAVIAAQPSFYWMGGWQAQGGSMWGAVRGYLDRVDHDTYNTPTACGRAPRPGHFWHNRPFRQRYLEAARQAFARRVRSAHRRPAALLVFKGFEENVDGCHGNNGAGDHPAVYRQWIDSFAAGVGGHPAVVVLEPDGLGLEHCLSRAARGRRLALLRYASRLLSQLPNTGVYIDAGAADWRSAHEMAVLLRRAGVAWARGFALNVTHYDWTGAEVAYGNRISRALRGKHFVVNTVMNGRGPLRPAHPERLGNEIWCNPPGRRLGAFPTTRTGRRRVDAYLWIGNAAVADAGGHCGRYGGMEGGPPGHAFWPAYGIMLARGVRAPGV